jgi:bifunctional NMN adenylyltransferase/nudix hydrolase
VIYSTQNAFPYVKACVDIACIKKLTPGQNEKGETVYGQIQILLGRKASENKWRLPGGMVDKGENFEQAAARELSEETGLTAEIKLLKYVGSYSVSDWRFKNAGEIGLLTSLFIVDYTWGAPTANDDLAELKWCDITLAEDEVVKGHKTLIAAVKKALNI